MVLENIFHKLNVHGRISVVLLDELTERLKYVLVVSWYNMITKEQILIFKSSADALFVKGDYTSATILYFKTLFAIQDFALLEETGESPKDHSARFRMLEKHLPDLYRELNLEFDTYRDTYSKIIDKETCIRIRHKVENDLKKHLA